MKKVIPSSRAATALLTTALALPLTMMFTQTSVIAGPGAHGPNGEHLDAPASSTVAAALPRLEAQTDAFELVGILSTRALSVLIDRYTSNEPVLGASLEIEVDGVKARATFRADRGDYAFDDQRLLALLSTPGEHALVFTLVTGAESDLLDATLVTTAAAAHGHAHDDHGHDHTMESVAWGVGGAVVLGLVGGYVWRRRRAEKAVTLKGAL